MKHLLWVVLLFCTSLAFGTETLKIDFRYNTRADDGKNHLYWQTKDTKVHDYFDAVSGASKARSTKQLRQLQAPSNVKQFPKGLYALLLFAVTPAAQGKTDALTVETIDGHLTISFQHRGNAYLITADEKGRLHTRTSFMIAENFAAAEEGTAEPAAENTAETASEAVPHAEAPLPFVQDDYGDNAEFIWDGRLKAAYTDGILTITGKLKKIEKPERPAPPAAEAPQDASDQPAADETAEATEAAETFTPPLENDTIETN